MKQAIGVFLVLLSFAIGDRLWAADPTPPLASRLAGSTLSAVTYMPKKPGMPGGGELARVIMQAYLRADGGAVVRVWDPSRNAYTAAVERRWSLSGSRLCIDLPSGTICADVHVWGPRIAGIGTNPYAMLDGDLRSGNAITATR